MPSGSTLSGIRVLVWGLGHHGGGLAAARLCRAEGAQVSILDAKPASQCGDDGQAALAEGFPCLTGDATHRAFHGAELIVPSPAIPPRAWPASHPPRRSPEALALERHTGRRVAVTGTKGKSTTAMLTGALLGWRVAGNSWRPLCEIISEDPAADLVCELSSFQLWYLQEQRPQFDAAILTLLAADHLDWHPDLQHYRSAKLALLDWAGAVAVAPQAMPMLPPGLPLLPASPIPAQADMLVPGAHNRANAALALAVARHLGAPEAELLPRLGAAKPLPHRLCTVHGSGQLRFVDDSIATMPEAAIAGLNAFDGRLAIILGGSDKGADFEALAAAIVERQAKPVLIGATAPRIHAALLSVGIDAPICPDLDAAIRLAVTAIASSGTILLSPACASFDMFRGFDDRGACFCDAAKRLFP